MVCTISFSHLLLRQIAPQTLERCAVISSIFSPRAFISRTSRFRRKSAAGVQFSSGGGKEPSPTRDRNVSGWKLSS